MMVTLLVFPRKDLCDARPKPEESSKKADVPLPLIEPSIQSSTTPGQYDLLQNAEVLSAH